LLKRRAEMLDTVSKGFHPSTVISQIAEKYHVTEKCVWNDWGRRKKWVPVLLDLEKYSEFAQIVESKLNAVQKAAWSIYLRAGNDNARVGALKVVLESLDNYSNAVLSGDMVSRLERVEELVNKKVTEDEKS
jgi:hypothetical protein